MKKTLLSCFLLLVMAVTASAQIVKGDMNDDKTVDITDVVSSVNVVLGSQPMEVISASDIVDPYMVDNSKVIGTWYKTKTEKVTFGEDGTTDYTGATTYKFLPYQGKLLLFNTTGALTKILTIAYLSADSLYLDNLTLYTTTVPPTRVAAITLDNTELAMTPAQKQQLSASVSPEDADNKNLVWTSSDESVATVTEEGLVTAIGRGSSTITCMAADGSGTLATCTVTVTGTVYVTSITLDETSLVLVVDATKKLIPTISPSNADDKSVAWSSSNEDVATVTKTGLVVAISAGTATITCSANDGSGVKARCVVNVYNTIDGHAYVDLGLTSGTLWATTNVGADSPEEYGDYFAWGETTPQSDNAYTWVSYKWCNGTHNKITKYCTNSSYGNDGFTDGKAVLDANDDAARANWGGDWRMPTRAEFEELIDNTRREWTKQNNVAGYKFTSKTNGNSIFLPAAGYRSYSVILEKGSYGYYWSSSLDESYPDHAWSLSFNDGWERANYGYYRYFGQSVRPVR